MNTSQGHHRYRKYKTRAQKEKKMLKGKEIESLQKRQSAYILKKLKTMKTNRLLSRMTHIRFLNRKSEIVNLMDI